MSKKKKNQPEYGQYCFCYKCGKTLCKAIDLPNLDINYCPNCGNKLTDTKKSTDERIQSTQNFLTSTI